MVFFPVLYYGVIFCYLVCLSLWKNHGNWALLFLAIPCLLASLMLAIDARESRRHNAERWFEKESKVYSISLFFMPGLFFVITCFVLGVVETLSFLSTFKEDEYLNLLFLFVSPIAFAFSGQIFAKGLRDTKHTAVVFSSIFSFFYAMFFTFLAFLFSGKDMQSGYLQSSNVLLDVISAFNSMISNQTSEIFAKFSLEWVFAIMSLFGNFTQYFAICLSLALSFNLIRHQLTKEVEHYE